MKFEDALNAMREGKKVRQPCRCYYMIDEFNSGNSIIDASGDHARFEMYDLLAEDWEIIEDK